MTLVGVFFAAFLAGSIVAFPSEAVVVAAVVARVAPVPVVVTVATVGNLIGAVTVFAVGRVASRAAEGRAAAWWSRRASPERIERARSTLSRWGSPALLLSWVPVVGDALVLAAGVLRVSWTAFLVYVTIGKAARYVIVAWSAQALSG